MQLTCLQENLSRALALVGRGVATRTTLPVTQNILISTDAGRLKLTATNLEIAITTWIGASIETEGEVTIPARLFSDFVNSLPSGEVTITLTDSPLGVEMHSGKFECRILGVSAEEFPPIPTVDGDVLVSIPAATLRKSINQVAFAAATEDSRPVLTGVQIEIQSKQLTFAAADGFRLAVHKSSIDSGISESIDFIVPSRTLRELERIIADVQTDVQMSITPTKNQVLFKSGEIELTSQLLAGSFPNYNQLIPQNYSTRAIVDANEFSRATRSASIFARDGSGIVRLQVSPGTGEEDKLIVSARAEELGDNSGEIIAQTEGDESKIAFSSKYLSDVLNILGSDKVILETTSPSSPGVFKQVGDESYIHVIMPMFVQW